MNVTAYRLTERTFARAPFDPFDGKGAARAGGRWNPPGTAVVYASWCLSLAVLEILVHNRGRLENLGTFLVHEMDFDDRHIERVAVDQLPSDWSSPYQPPAALAERGLRWANERRSAVLAVPSTVIATEWNYLLNPNHPDFSAFIRRPPHAIAMDPRLLGESSRAIR